MVEHRLGTVDRSLAGVLEIPRGPVSRLNRSSSSSITPSHLNHLDAASSARPGGPGALLRPTSVRVVSTHVTERSLKSWTISARTLIPWIGGVPQPPSRCADVALRSGPGGPHAQRSVNPWSQSRGQNRSALNTVRNPRLAAQYLDVRARPETLNHTLNGTPRGGCGPDSGHPLRLVSESTETGVHRRPG